MLNVIITSLPCILPLVVFPKALLSALYITSCTLPLSVPYLFPFPWPPPLCRWYSAFLLFPPTQLWLKHFLTFKTLFNRSLPEWLLIFVLLTPLRILAHQTQKATCQNTQLFTWHLPLCSKSWLHLWQTSYLLWLSHSSTPLYPALSRFVKRLVPLLPLSFTRNLITLILSTIKSLKSLSLNYPVSSRSRTLLLVLSLKLLSPVISLPSYSLSTGSESLNA